MTKEFFDIFDVDMNHIGIEERSKVHQKGYWHKAFHCWFYQIENGMLQVLFQKRQHDKDTHPNLLDISAAGHLTAGERPEEGIREVEEELGIQVKWNELESIGVIPASYVGDTFIDNEFCYTYFYHFKNTMEKIIPDPVEVAGIYQVPFLQLEGLFNGLLPSINVSGFQYKNNKLVSEQTDVELKDFVPHPEQYYKVILDKLSKINKVLST
ncbi:MAG: NUDIX hydrolase [Heyndrickxia sp.]